MNPLNPLALPLQLIILDDEKEVEIILIRMLKLCLPLLFLLLIIRLETHSACYVSGFKCFAHT